MATLDDSPQSFAPREARSIFDTRTKSPLEPTFEDVIEAIDWNRVLIEAMGEHGSGRFHPLKLDLICGGCIKRVLLRKDDG